MLFGDDDLGYRHVELAFGDDDRRTARDRRGDEIVAVGPRAAQSDEQRSRPHVARVGGQRVDGRRQHAATRAPAIAATSLCVSRISGPPSSPPRGGPSAAPRRPA